MTSSTVDASAGESGTRIGAAVILVAYLIGLWLLLSAGWSLCDADSAGSHTLSGMRGLALAGAALGVVFLFLGSRQVLRQRVVEPRALRDGFVLLVLAVVAQVVLSPRYKPILFELSVGGAAVGVACLQLLKPRLRSLRQMRIIRLLELLAFQVVLLLVLAEGGLKLAAGWIDAPLLMRDEQGVASAIATYRFAPDTLRMGFPVNSGGHYDEEFKDRADLTVAAIGDSFSQGVVPHRYHFTTVCERSLPGVAVHNFGHAGIGPGAYLHLLETEVLAIQPDVIVINLFVGNDLAEAMRWRNRSGWLRSFCDRRNVLTYLVPQRLARVVKESLRDRETGGGILGRPCEVEFDAPTSDPETLERAMPWLLDPKVEPPSISPEEYLRIERKRAKEIRTADATGGYAQVFEILTEIRRVAGAIPVAVLLIPDEFQVEDGLWEEVSSGLPGLTLDREQPQRRLSEWLRERQIPVLDLLPILRSTPRTAAGDRHLYHRRDTHFNRRGNEIAGAALASFLDEHFRK